MELGELPDELLPALSKFLIISKDEIDQGKDYYIDGQNTQLIFF